MDSHLAYINLFQAYLKIQSQRPIPSVIKRSRHINPVFPYGIVAAYVYHAVVIFTHQVQAVQGLCPETVTLPVETEVGSKGKAVVFVKTQSVKLDDRSMYAQCSPTLESEMLGGSYIEAGKVIGIFVCIIEHDVSATCLLMTARIVCTQNNLRCPCFPPAFLPCT